jgi:hypothetical protein
MALVLLADFKTHYPGVGDTENDAINTCLADAESYIKRKTGRVFEDPGADATRYFDAVDDVDANLLILFLDRDLESVTSITNGDGETVTADQYKLWPTDPPHSEIRLLTAASVNWTYEDDPDEAIAVAGRWWCSNTEAVAGATKAVRDLAKHYFTSRRAEREVIHTPVGTIIRHPDDVPQSVKEFIADWGDITS